MPSASCDGRPACFAGFYTTFNVTGQSPPFTPSGFKIDGDGRDAAIGYECDDISTCMPTNSLILFSGLEAHGDTLTSTTTVTEPHACASDPMKGSCVSRYTSTTLSRPAWIAADGAQIETCTVDFAEPSCTTPLPTHCDPIDVNHTNCVVTVIAGQYTL